MSGRIPQQFIDDLVSRLDIVDVIGSRVRLKKSGSNFTACCPFHQEKTPSFYVYTDSSNAHYHCFGCGVHGTALQFVQEFDHISFPETIELLSRQLGLEVPKNQQDFKPDPNKAIHDALEWAREQFREQLRSHPQRQMALDYLARRGLNEEIIERYQIGFTPANASLLAQNASSLQLKALKEAKIILEKDGRHFDLFHNRIMFPIRDRRGKTIAFGGRTLGNDRSKYINSPESPVFHKSSHLYGLYESLKIERPPKRLLVVEGYMDVVALAQFGIYYGVATLGTATNQENLSFLLRQCQDVVFCFDGDRAGFEAARKATNNCLPMLQDGMNLRFLMLPEGEDPDTLIRKEGAEAFSQRLDNARPLSLFFFDLHSEGLNLDLPEHKGMLKTKVEPILNEITAPILRNSMRDHLRSLTDVFFARKQNFLKRQASKEQKAPRADVQIKPGTFLCLALYYEPARWRDFQALLEMDLVGADFQQTRQLIHYLKDRNIQSQSALMEHLTQEASSRQQFASLFNHLEYIPDAEAAVSAAQDVFKNFQRDWSRRRFEELSRKLHESATLNESEYAELRRLTAALA